MLSTQTPNTVNFMIAGYSVIFGIMAVYITSLILRWRNLKRELQRLEEMREEK